MIGDLILIEPFALTHAGPAPGYSVSAGSGGANLISLDPREVWQNAGNGAYTIDIDLGSVTAWDSIALINVEASMAATWVISGGNTGYAELTYQAAVVMRLPSEDGVSDAGPAVYHWPAGIGSRYVRIAITPNGAPTNSIGALVIGKSYKPILGKEQGSGRPLTDTGNATRLDGGGLATVPGHLLSGHKWVFGDLDVPDLRKLQGILKRRRTTEPLVVIEDTGEMYAEGVHYGRFVDLEPFERRDTSKSRWALTVEDWV